MRVILAIIILALLSFSASAGVCSVTWTHDNHYKDGTPIYDENLAFELWSKGNIIKSDIPGHMRGFQWRQPAGGRRGGVGINESSIVRSARPAPSTTGDATRFSRSVTASGSRTNSRAATESLCVQPLSLSAMNAMPRWLLPSQAYGMKLPISTCERSNA